MKKQISKKFHHYRIGYYVLAIGLALCVFGTASALIKPGSDNVTAAGSAVARSKGAGDSAVVAAKAQQAKAAAQAAKAAEAAKAQQAAQAQAQAAAAAAKPAPTPAATSANPLRGFSFYVDPALAGRPAEIASRPVAKWFGSWGDPAGDMNAYATAAAAAGQVPVAVLYNIPSRDCGSYSAGGAGSEAAYNAWIDGLVTALGQRRAVVIIEPDALAQADCLPGAAQAARYRILANAVTQFKTRTAATVYLDAGHAKWKPAATMVAGLRQANIAQADGFALNVSNFQPTTDNVVYGNAITAQVGKGFVIDTSRNGRGANSEWCNPNGRGLGRVPTSDTGVANVHAFLWIKSPGESDGTCNNAPEAGVWWPVGAAELVRNATYQ